MTQPIRLQLKRTKGFNLQAASRAANGLAAINVTRASVRGNPFRIVEAAHNSFEVEGPGIWVPIAIPTRIQAHTFAVGRFRIWARENAGQLRLEELRGYNLACWCKPHLSCHVDVLLEILAQ